MRCREWLDIDVHSFLKTNPLKKQHTGRFLSQAPTIRVFHGKALPDFLELHFLGNSTYTCSNSLWPFCTPRFFPCWTVVRWWSRRSREHDLWRPITSEPLNGIVCGWCQYKMLCDLSLKILKSRSYSIRKVIVFGPYIPKYPHSRAHNERLKIVALAPTAPIFNWLCVKNWFGPILTCFNVNELQKGAGVFGLARSGPDPGIEAFQVLHKADQ